MTVPKPKLPIPPKPRPMDFDSAMITLILFGLLFSMLIIALLIAFAPWVLAGLVVLGLLYLLIWAIASVVHHKKRGVKF